MATKYAVVVAGCTMDRFDSEEAAIADAKGYDASQSPEVIMEEQDGTYSSKTRVWPTAGATHSN